MRVVTTLFVVGVLGLLAVGLVELYSISNPLREGTHFLDRQLVACGLGLAVAGTLALSDYRRLRPLSWWLLGAAVVLLALVLVPHIGVKVNGARRWFRVQGFQFQPSDFAKLALLIALAHYGAHCQRLMQGFRRGILVPGLVIGVVLGLIFLEPDWGTALLLSAVSGTVLLLAGVRWRYLLPPVGGGVASVVLLLILNPLRSDRIHSWLHLEETKDKVGYQAWQARIALGAGGATGLGLNNSIQKQFVPEHRTDFMFAIVGEEFGYLGSLTVMAAFLMVFICGVVIAWHARDTFGLLLAGGISFLIGLQALVNLGVVSGALPNKGLALPFLSYGGSNLIVMLACAGIVVSIARGADERQELPSTTLTPAAPLAPAV